MQNISAILKIENGKGTWVNDGGGAAATPSFYLGVLGNLVIDMRGAVGEDADSATLPAYPLSELSGLSVVFGMDTDYDRATIPPFVKLQGITASTDDHGRTICVIPLPNTDTPAMRDVLGVVGSLAFTGELVARNAEGRDEFAVQFPITVNNRILSPDTTATPDTTSPDWLPTVDALIRAAVTSMTDDLKGDAGVNGADGADGEDGADAFEVWRAIPGNENATKDEFFAALKGAKGDTGEAGAKGDKGDTGAKGDKGDPGAALCYAFNADGDPRSADWHTTCQKSDQFWRISADNGVTWSAPRKLEQAAVAPIARFAPVAQMTDAAWQTRETQTDDYTEYPAGVAYFRVHVSGFPWTEPRLFTAQGLPAQIDNATLAQEEQKCKAGKIRAQFSSDGQSWHGRLQEGDLHIRFFSTTGTVNVTWNLTQYGALAAIEGIEVAESGPQWHDAPQDGDKFMKVSLDGGKTWYARCFQIEGGQGEKGEAGTPGPKGDKGDKGDQGAPGAKGDKPGFPKTPNEIRE